MTISLSSIANSALGALNSYQVAINITNTNVSNSETEGYTRQTAVLESTTSSVDVTIKRVYSSFLTNRLRTESQELGFYDAEQEVLSSVETIFNESSTSGLSSDLSDFWNSWSDVVDDPSDSSMRSILLSSADTLAGTLNSMNSDLNDIQSSIDDTVVDTVGTINELVKEIAELNQNIAKAETSGQDSNTDKDSLDLLVTELSSYIGINTYTDDNGQINITLENGKPLVSGSTTWSLSTATNTTTGLQDITWLDQSGAATVITDDITTGKLGGYLEVRDDIIPSYQAQLDELASEIATQVNALHITGFDLNGDAGLSFFTDASGGTTSITAANISVNSAILADTNLIAASGTADGIPDDGSVASTIADLQDSLLLDSGTSTMSSFYAALVSEVGSKVSSVTAKYEAQESVVNTCQSNRDSVSSVSSDEELTKLMLYQNAYEASAQIMTTIDELMQTIINM